MSHVLHVAFFGFNFVHSASVCVCVFGSIVAVRKSFCARNHQEHFFSLS